MSDLSGLRYTPFDGSSPSFTIGLNLLDILHWFEPDEHLAAHLVEKKRLWTAYPEQTFAASEESVVAQQETLQLIAEHLPKVHPTHYRRDRDCIEVTATGDSVCVESADEMPLMRAASLVQEDLCLMGQKGGTLEWSLIAASLSFPSHWSLQEKIQKPLGEIHKGVPRFAGAMESRVQRIFDNLRVDRPVWRLNWSLQEGQALFQPNPSTFPRFEGMNEHNVLNNGFLRVERQTLRRLPRSDAILFTIKTYLDPLALLIKKPELARHMANAISNYSDEELSYKGLTDAKDKLVKALLSVH